MKFHIIFATILLRATNAKQAWKTDPILPIPVTPGAPSSCGLVPGPGGDNGNVEPVDAVLDTLCFAEDWVYCINAKCEPDAITVDEENDDISYGGKPFVKCSCWKQPSDTCKKLSNLPYAKGSGASCVLGVTYGDAPSSDTGGRAMCDAMKAGALISTYGPEGDIYDFDNKDYIGPFDNGKETINRAVCEPETPWAWCWGAPCVEDHASPTGITCHCPYMMSDSTEPQELFLDQSTGCDSKPDPCDTMQNSGPAGTLGEKVWNSSPCQPKGNFP